MSIDDQDDPKPTVNDEQVGTQDTADAQDAAESAETVAEETVPEFADEPAAERASEAVSTEPAPVEGASGGAAAPEAVNEELARLGADQLLGIVEALVFASPEPLTLKMLTKLLADEPQEDVAAAVQALIQHYDRPGGLHVVEVAGGYQITTRPECHEWVRRLFHERTTQKLSVQALETLAVIAYKQPITAAEIGEIRGVNTSGVLSTLLERHLIKIVGRKNVIGRPFLYGSTREFLIRFGLKDLSDLPRVEDMAQALGFDAPAILRERSVSDEMLPLEEEQGT